MAHVGKWIFLWMFLLFAEFIPTKPSHDEQHCRMEDFPVQENFDEDRFQGKWYEASWIIPAWIEPEWNFYDYIHNNTKTSYGFLIYAEGRWPFNDTDCVEPSYIRLLRTQDNAKYLYEYESEDGLISTTLWVVDTDYNNYALIIGCRDLAPNGTCLAPDGWLWTRCQNKPRKHVEYMESRLPDFCLSKDQFHTTYHSMECRADIPASCPVEDTVGAGYGLQSALITSVMAPILSVAIFIRLC